MNVKHSDTLSDFHDYGANVKTREVFLQNYPDNGENPGIDYRTANNFIKNIRALDLASNKDILVHLYSIGGEWNDCMAMYDAINFCKSKITMISYGQAESASSIVLQAASTRLLMPKSYFMCHYGTSGYSGQYVNVHNWNDFEKKYVTEIMIDIYANRCIRGAYFKEKNYTIDQVKKYLHKRFKQGDWYINPEDAVHYGFADGVLGSRKYPNLDCLINN